MAAILARARAVVAYTSHSGCTRCDLRSISLPGHRFAVCGLGEPVCGLPGADAVAADVGMQGEGEVQCRRVLRHGLEVAFGVKTKISDANKFSLMVSRKSMASGCGSSRISLMVRNHFSSSPSSSLPPPLCISSGRQSLVRQRHSCVHCGFVLQPLPVVTHKGDV